jgi:biopolymer transport protein ExbD
MKLSSRRSRNGHGGKARIEIIPLIDIMFFLLACFMLVSLSMIEVKGIKVNLPVASTAQPEKKSDFYTISVDKKGDVYLDKKPMDRAALLVELMKLGNAGTNETRIYISGDREVYFGSVIDVLDKVKLAGIQKVAFEINRASAVPDAASAKN